MSAPDLPSAPAGFATGTLLRHYKGGLYRVAGECLIEATLEPGVLYRPCQGDMQHVTWMRPLSQFHDTVPGPNGPVARFTVVDEDAGAFSAR